VTKQNSKKVDADRAWHALVAMVMDSRGDWRRKISEASGIPFSRFRALKRLVDAPMTLKELAEAMTTDAPAATVAINDLEERGLVERYPHPTDRRAKLVSITAAGRRVTANARRVVEAAPDSIQALSAEDLDALLHILDKINPQT
jgi:DNA-binding MarR family transcriptional regulator